MQPQTKNKISLALILLFFLGPIAIIWLIYNYNPGYFAPMSKSNYGEFISPPKKFKSSGLKDLQGNAITLQNLGGYWTYVYIDSSKCDQICQRNLYYQRQIRLLQGPEMGRVKALFVVTDNTGLGELKPNLKNFPALTVATISTKQVVEFKSQFEVSSSDSSKGSSAMRRIFLMDPKGQLMMFYNTNNEPSLNKKLAKGMYKDLKKLLKINKDVVKRRE